MLPSYNYNRSHAPFKVYYTGSDTILGGYALCFDHDNATAGYRGTRVEKPSVNNIGHGFVVAQEGTNMTGPGDVWVYPVTAEVARNISVYTDQNVAAGDLLSPHPDTYFWRQWLFGERPVFRALEAQDRTSTNGTVVGEYGLLDFDWFETNAKRIVIRVGRDCTNPSMFFLNGATEAELEGYAWEARGASVGVAFTSGVLVITPNTTNIGQINTFGLPVLLAAGAACLWRAKLKVSDITQEFFAGLAIAGAVMASDGIVCALDDYAGFMIKGSVNGSLHICTNKDNGTDSVNDTTVDAVNDTYVELMFIVNNVKTGTSAGNKTLRAWVNGTLTNDLATAGVAALINDDEAMNVVVGAIGGSANVVTIDKLECICYLG